MFDTLRIIGRRLRAVRLYRHLIRNTLYDVRTAMEKYRRQTMENGVWNQYPKTGSKTHPWMSSYSVTRWVRNSSDGHESQGPASCDYSTTMDMVTCVRKPRTNPAEGRKRIGNTTVPSRVIVGNIRRLSRYDVQTEARSYEVNGGSNRRVPVRATSLAGYFCAIFQSAHGRVFAGR